MRILVAEDDFVSGVFMQKFLERYGICDVVKNGFEALDLFIRSHDEEKPYDLVCLDVRMPKISGIKTLEKIRAIEDERGIAHEEKTNVFMVSAIYDTDTIKKAYASGCNYYFEKPLDMQKMSIKINGIDSK